MRHVPTFVVLVALLGLAGCQSLQGESSDQDTGHLSHSYSNITRAASTEPGYAYIFTYDETFQELQGVGVRLDRSTLCREGSECTQSTYSIDIPPNQTFVIPSSLPSNSENESYTETYFGQDYQGNAVALTVTFRSSGGQSTRPAGPTFPERGGDTPAEPAPATP